VAVIEVGDRHEREKRRKRTYSNEFHRLLVELYWRDRGKREKSLGVDEEKSEIVEVVRQSPGRNYLRFAFCCWNGFVLN
jgi:hypothetical protein